MSYEPVLIRDHFQNFKRHNIPKAQLIIADIPYNIGKDLSKAGRAGMRDDAHRRTMGALFENGLIAVV